MKNAFQSQTPYQNWIHIKPELENNQNLIAIVKDSIREQRRFNDAPNYLGSGESNVVLQLGELQIDNNTYHLAFRTRHGRLFEKGSYGCRESGAIFDMACFDQFAEKNMNEQNYYIRSLEFFGLIKWVDESTHIRCNRFGIIIPDLTKGGKYEVVALDYENAAVHDNEKIYDEKVIGRYFIDPLFSPDKEERAKKYLNSAIDLGNFLKKS